MPRKPLIFILSLILTFCFVGALPAVAEKSDTDIAYPAEGGNIYFDSEIGEITACDKGVTNAVIPEEISGIAVKYVGKGAFAHCEALKNVSVPSAAVIDKGAFAYCRNLLSVSAPNAVSIGESAFYGCAMLTDADVQNASDIGKRAFSGCDSLRSVSLPNALNIGAEAFFYCGALESVTLPKSLANIGELAFTECRALKNIGVDAENPNFTSDNGVLFDKNKTELLMYPVGKEETSYTVPDSVTRIGNYAFGRIASLEKINMPSVMRIGEGAFIECYELTSVSMPKCEIIERSAFSGCRGLKSVYLPKSLSEVAESAFAYCESLSDVYYEGSKGSGKKLRIGSGNLSLEYPTEWHYNSARDITD